MKFKTSSKEPAADFDACEGGGACEEAVDAADGVDVAEGFSAELR